MPYPVYGGYEGKNDMNDDINVRSRTVNYLAGKSLFNPTEEGLGIPFEMSMALHSDAGFSKEDEIIALSHLYHQLQQRPTAMPVQTATAMPVDRSDILLAVAA